MSGFHDRQQPNHSQAESLIVDDYADGWHCLFGDQRESRRGAKKISRKKDYKDADLLTQQDSSGCDYIMVRMRSSSR